MAKVKGLRWYILALVAVGTVINYLDRNVLGILAPQLKDELHFSTEQYSYIVAAFGFCYAFMQPVAGYLIDFLKLRLGFFIFALAWGLACALHAFAGGWQSMAGFRALLGVSEAGAIPSAVKTATVWFPPQERSVAAGWVTTGSSIGAMIAPPLVIWLSLTWGWQAAFMTTGLMAVGMAFVWLLLYRDPEQPPSPQFPGTRSYPGRPGNGATLETLPRECPGPAQVLGHRSSPFPDRTRLADLQLLDSAVHDQHAGNGHQAVRAVCLAAVPGLGSRLHPGRLPVAAARQALQHDAASTPASPSSASGPCA